jgi:hypothetical protein
MVDTSTRVQRQECSHTLLEFFRNPHPDGEARLVLQCQECGTTFGENARLEQWPDDPSTILPLVRWARAGLLRQLLLDFPPNE